MDHSEHERWWRTRGARELRELLYNEWDPIRVKDLAEDARDEYEAYTGQLMRRLRAGASEEEVTALLASFRVDMGLEPVESDAHVARRIHAWFPESRARFTAWRRAPRTGAN